MPDAEESIARIQLKGGAGVAEHQNKAGKNLDNRIVTALFALGFMGLMVVWATAKSPFLTYGSLVLAIAGVVLLGVVRVRRIEQLREERRLQAEQFSSGAGDTNG